MAGSALPLHQMRKWEEEQISLSVEGFGAEAAYTVDGGALGELEYENFNAASGHVTIQGKGIHPGSAKGKMKNALLIAMEFQALLPAFEILCIQKVTKAFIT